LNKPSWEHPMEASWLAHLPDGRLWAPSMPIANGCASSMQIRSRFI
jgi:hypothetical protein